MSCFERNSSLGISLFTFINLHMFFKIHLFEKCSRQFFLHADFQKGSDSLEYHNHLSYY